MESERSKERKKKRDRLAARLTRGSQPARRRVNGKRFSRDNQPRRRGRRKGARNLLTREVKDAIILGLSELGEDLRGKGGLVGFIKRIGRHDLKCSAMLLRALIPMSVSTEQKHEVTYKSLEEARADLERTGIFLGDIFKLEHAKHPKLIDAEMSEVIQDSKEADVARAGPHSKADDAGKSS
jgi:hypothetical protein